MCAAFFSFTLKDVIFRKLYDPGRALFILKNSQKVWLQAREQPAALYPGFRFSMPLEQCIQR